MVRKGGLEPPRYCYRQPLKLVDLLRGSGLTRILRTVGTQECAAAHASDDSIRTNSHTRFEGEISIRLRSRLQGTPRLRRTRRVWCLRLSKSLQAVRDTYNPEHFSRSR